MITKSIFYRHNVTGSMIEVVARAGEDISPYCYPGKDLNFLAEYTEIELLFFKYAEGNRDGESVTVESIIGAPVNELFTFKYSLYDRAVCAANCSNSKGNCLIERDCFLDIKLASYSWKRIEEHAEQKPEPKGGCFCRSCNDYNEYMVADNVICDGKFTCWSCASNPYRRSKGLATKEQIDRVTKLNNIK